VTAGFIDTGGKFANDVNDAGGIQFVVIALLTLTKCKLRPEILQKILIALM
jgi:hypothetical protein